MKKNIFICMLIAVAALGSCRSAGTKVPSITKTDWGTANGQRVFLFTLTNKTGMMIKISNFGGALTTVSVPDRSGKFANVVLGYDSLRPYFTNSPHFGCIIGRYANRIGKARFTLNGVVYKLTPNDGVNQLHGGIKGFDKKVWEPGDEFATPDSTGLSLSYTSKDMEEGYPGDLKVKVRYVLTNQNEIKIYYRAQTDKPTVVNLTNHSYFNLTACKRDVLNNQVKIYADSITPTDSTFIPTGILKPVKGTCYDFTSFHTIGERINEIPGIPGGYDINYKLRKEPHTLSLAAEVYDPASGRVLQTYTTEPGLQFYTSNFLNSHIAGHGGLKYPQHYGVCFEAQHFPDSPNKPQFPSTVLNPGQTYTQLTIYKFSTR